MNMYRRRVRFLEFVKNRYCNNLINGYYRKHKKKKNIEFLGGHVEGMSGAAARTGDYR